MPTEGTLRVNGQDAWRIVITGVWASGGIGLARITVDLELRARSDTWVGRPVWLGATLRLHSPGLANNYLCDLVATVQPSNVPNLAEAATLRLEGSISWRQLKLVEGARNGEVHLDVELRGHSVDKDGAHPIWGVSLDYLVPQSTWIEHLGAWGYRNVMLLEIERPGSGRTPQMARATQYLSEAQAHFLLHSPRATVESLRQCLVALVGETVPSDTSEEEVTTALRAAQNDARGKAPTSVGYNRRLELIRLALKFATDLAAHPEVANTSHADAESLFVMTAGLVQRLGRDNG